MASSSRNGRARYLSGEPIALPSSEVPADRSTGEDAASAKPSLKSFVFEVSASRPYGVGDATEVQIRIDPPAGGERRSAPYRRRLRRSATQPSSGRAKRSEADQPSTAADSIVQSQVIKAHASHGADRRPDSKPQLDAPRLSSRLPSRSKPPRRRMPPWAASSGVHGLVFAALLFGQIPGIEPLDELLWSTAPPLEEVAFTDVDFEATQDDERRVDGEDVAEELIDPGQASFGELSNAAALAEVGGEPTLPAGAFGGDIGALFGTSGAGLAKFDAGLGDAPTAKFFGAKIGTG